MHYTWCAHIAHCVLQFVFYTLCITHYVLYLVYYTSKGSHLLPNQMFLYTLCKRPLTPPLGFTQSCCEFFDINVKKCVNVCRDKIWHNSAKICGQNVKFTLKLWQFYPWKYFFVSISCCQKAFRMIQICNINFYTWVWPPLYTMCKKTSDLVEDGFP